MLFQEIIIITEHIALEMMALAWTENGAALLFEVFHLSEAHFIFIKWLLLLPSIGVSIFKLMVTILLYNYWLGTLICCGITRT